MGRKNPKKTDNYWDSDEYLKDNPELRKVVEEKERESQETLRRIKEQYGSAPPPSLSDDEAVVEDDDDEGKDKENHESSDKVEASVIAEPQDDEVEDEDEEEEEKPAHKKKKKAVVKKEKEKPRKKNHKKKAKVEEDVDDEILDDDEHDIEEEIRLAKEQERKYKEAVKAFMSDEEDDKASDEDENLEDDDDDEEEEEVKPYTYRDLEIVAKRVVDWLKGENVVIKDGIDVSNDQSSSSSSSKKNNKDDDEESEEPKRPNTKVALRQAIEHLCFIKGRLDPDLYVNFCFVSGIWQKDPEGPQGGNDQRVLYAEDWKKQVKSPRIKREMQKLGPFIEKSLKDFFTNLAAIKGKLPQTRKEVREFSQANNQVTLEIAPDDVIDHLVSEGVITISDSFHEITNRKGEKQRIKVLGRVEYHEDKIGKIAAGSSSINFKKLIFLILMSMIVFSQFSFLKLLSPSSA
eukprot:TRINITY_DN4338_c0_g1_i1.p1 TRINITY_DN4338_c0_g1~~TRINITY_DN4338_c0_g1_i1.p1  ORF type:complete len:476 (-),score=309.59 TRINITY_DN4338_c0_g1_i1:67-1449(-)